MKTITLSRRSLFSLFLTISQNGLVHFFGAFFTFFSSGIWFIFGVSNKTIKQSLSFYF